MAVQVDIIYPSYTFIKTHQVIKVHMCINAFIKYS